jgi:hypothetical protein
MEPTAQISSSFDLVQIAIDAYNEFKEDIWWRGESRQEANGRPWRLVAGVYRESDNPNYEREIAYRFKMRAPVRHHPLPQEDNDPAWLFLMQHYRLPTRLLDWNESALNAAFFAVSEDVNKPGRLWELNPQVLNEICCGWHGPLIAQSREVLPIIKAAFSGASLDGEPIAAVMPPHVDRRILSQLGVFTVHGTRTPLEDHLRAREFLRLYEIPAQVKKQMALQLHILGIRRSSLFPDLENLARELKDKRFHSVIQ